ncbi:MAG: hypothetical protein PHC88_12435 [Terrimicrobiaceae bacterium]|nr:hypothetical protein [Terrimicrobiaceae bacterium]
MPRRFPLHLLLPLALLAALPLRAVEEDPQAAINARLREGLKNTMLQLQDAQGKAATLQAAQVADEAKIKDLTARLAKLTKQSADDKLAADKTIADLRQQVAAQDTRNAKQVEAIGEWKKAYAKLLDQARAVEAKRAELAAEKIKLDRKVADQERRNWAMYDLGKEILKRYERFGLGDALLAREPFVGIARVKFENFILDYSDKIADQKIKP